MGRSLQGRMNSNTQNELVDGLQVVDYIIVLTNVGWFVGVEDSDGTFPNCFNHVGRRCGTAFNLCSSPLTR
jgi:hypothetical protein